MTKKPLILFLFALAAGCTSPPPFDPGTDCPKEPNCFLCARHGGCAWCGNECIGVGRKECPPGMIRRVEGCPSSAPSAAVPPNASAKARP